VILLGCLLAFSAAVAPRLVLILAWIFSDRWVVVWQNNVLLPLLGIIFLPYTTVMYLLAWSPAVAGGGNIEGWDWLWIILGLFLDFMKWSQIIANRKEATDQVQKYYPSGAPRDPGQSGSVGAATTAPAPTPEPTPPAAGPAPSAPAAAARGAPAERDDLAELDKLKASGALTDEEYQAAKAKLKG